MMHPPLRYWDADVLMYGCVNHLSICQSSPFGECDELCISSYSPMTWSRYDFSRAVTALGKLFVSIEVKPQLTQVPIRTRVPFD